MYNMGAQRTTDGSHQRKTALSVQTRSPTNPEASGLSDDRTSLTTAKALPWGTRGHLKSGKSNLLGHHHTPRHRHYWTNGPWGGQATPSQRWRPPHSAAPHQDGAGRADVAALGWRSGAPLCSCACADGPGTMGRKREGLSVAREVRGRRRGAAEPGECWAVRACRACLCCTHGG